MDQHAPPDARLPNFMVIGAHKAGTTSLHHYLGQHPQVFMSAVKEPCFFAYLQRKGQPVPSTVPFAESLVYTWPDYARLFESAGDAIAVGESSTAYLTSKQAPHAIHQHIPGARIIAVLRHPVDRAYSQFVMNRQFGVETIADFEAALAAEHERRLAGWPAGTHDYAELGRYGRALARYHAIFPAAQIKVCRYEDLRDDAHGLLQDIFSFLGVDATAPVDVSARLLVGRPPPRSRRLSRFVASQSTAMQMVKSLVPAGVRTKVRDRLESANRSPARMTGDLRRRLIAAYRDDLLLLDSLTGKDFSRWLTE